MQPLSPEDAVRILSNALDGPGGADLVFGALAGVPGVRFEPATQGRMFRAGTPARLHADQWTFVASGKDSTIEVGHTVRGIVLSRSSMSAADAAAKLTPAVFEAARQQGGEATDAAQSAIGALGEVLGI